MFTQGKIGTAMYKYRGIKVDHKIGTVSKKNRNIKVFNQ